MTNHSDSEPKFLNNYSLSAGQEISFLMSILYLGLEITIILYGPIGLS